MNTPQFPQDFTLRTEAADSEIQEMIDEISSDPNPIAFRDNKGIMIWKFGPTEFIIATKSFRTLSHCE